MLLFGPYFFNHLSKNPKNNPKLSFCGLASCYTISKRFISKCSLDCNSQQSLPEPISKGNPKIHADGKLKKEVNSRALSGKMCVKDASIISSCSRRVAYEMMVLPWLVNDQVHVLHQETQKLYRWEKSNRSMMHNGIMQ